MDAEKMKQAFRYDGRCDQLKPDEVKARVDKGDGFTIRFRIPGGSTTWNDVVHGDITFPNKDVDDHKKRTIVGLSYWFPLLRGPSAALLADFEKVDYDTALSRPNERRYALHALLNF